MRRIIAGLILAAALTGCSASAKEGPTYNGWSAKQTTEMQAAISESGHTVEDGECLVAWIVSNYTPTEFVDAYSIEGNRDIMHQQAAIDCEVTK